MDYPTGEIADALSEYLTQARRQWSDAKIVEVFPAFVSSKPPDTYPELLDEVNSNLFAVDGTSLTPSPKAGTRTSTRIDGDRGRGILIGPISPSPIG